MLLKNGREINGDSPIVIGSTRFNSINDWLAKATPAQKAAEGFVEVEDAVRLDDRFFWNGNAQTPKDLDALKKMLLTQVTTSAHQLLSATDWMVVRASELPGKPLPQEIKEARADIRETAEAHKTKINACTTALQLSVLAFAWPSDQLAG